MSLDTFLDVWPNCLLNLPTFLATDLTSRSGRPALRMARGIGTPRTFLGRVRLFSIKPPATPAAPAPIASAGPEALPAVLFSVPTKPSLFLLALLRLALPALRPVDLLRLGEERFAALRLVRVAPEPLLAREALLRLRAEAAGFEREAPPEARDEPLRAVRPPERELLALGPEPDPFALAFEPEPFDELRLPRELRDAGLLLAISHPFRRGQPCPGGEYPPLRAVTKLRCPDRLPSTRMPADAHSGGTPLSGFAG